MAWHIIGRVSGLSISHCHQAGDAVSRSLAPAQVAVASFAATHALDSATARRLAIIVEEIVANVIRHADHNRAIVLSLDFQRNENGIFVSLEDDSTPFDPRSALPLELPDPDGGGIGLALVKAWSEIVCYDVEGGRNRLTLCLRLRDETAG